MTIVSSFRALFLGALLGIWVSLGMDAVAAEKEIIDPHAYRPGVRNSLGKHRLNEKQLKLIVARLAEKTGFTGLQFDAAGFLTLDDPTRFVGGSATARVLVQKAIQGATQLVLENHSYSQKVAFARIDGNLVYMNMASKLRMEHRSVQIDFPDFNKLIGAKEVLASFDLGMVLLHELVHGVLNLVDKVDEWEELGDCERYVNTIRKELNLPERQQYIARSQSLRSSLGWTIHLAELQFARPNYKNGALKTDEYKLHWDISRVGAGQREATTVAPSAVAEKNSERKSTAAIH